MSDNVETVGKLFDYAIELEKSAETLYRELAKMFIREREVAKFWEHYADEERGHAAYLERTKAGVELARLSMPADCKMIQDVQACLGAASRNRLDDIRNLEDAYQLATELENSETNAIFEFMITNFSADQLAESYKFLKIQLSSHIAKLETDLPSQYRSSIARENLTVSR